jgi:hypothetical protein
MKNSGLEVDPKQYGQLLARKLPAVIRTEEENQRFIGELEELDERHDELAPVEREYAELLTVWVEAFEEASYALEGSTPDRPLAQSDGGAWPAAERFTGCFRVAWDCVGGGEREAGS